MALTDAALVPLLKSETFKTVIPSRIIKAAAMQKPILLGVEGLAREVVENHEAGICFEPEHEGDFLKKVSLLKEDRNMYQKLQEGCVRLAHAYDRKGLAKLMLDHLTNVSSAR